MRIPDWQVEMVRLIGQELIRQPEKYTGGLRVNSLEGVVSTINLEISFKPEKERNGVAV